MTRTSKKHMTEENREVIEFGIAQGDSAGTIAKRIGVSKSSVTREVKKNRTVKEKNAQRGANLALRCVHYNDCSVSGLVCKKCSTRLAACKHCKTHNCIYSCSDFERKMCPTTEKWPYVCSSSCTKRAHCGFPKCTYTARDAHATYLGRLSSSREGIDLTEQELEDMKTIVVPLVKKGQSFEAIWATHAHELPVGVRCAYNYQDAGLFGITHVDLPRKVRMKKRVSTGKSNKAKRERVDRTGRTYDDFNNLSLSDKARVVQTDSVEGFQENVQDVLSLHLVVRNFQIYVPKKHGDAQATVAWLDAMERACKSRAAFEAAFGIILADRGVEFDDWEGMERSCLELGQRRCRVFYCDAMNSNQKSQAERNHEQLRRILPKGRSDFDKLSAWDVAVCCSHVNSYPIADRSNKCAFELLGDVLVPSLLDELGLTRVAPDDVILKPYLMRHAVAQ